MYKSVLFKSLTLIGVVWVASVFSGCQSVQVEQQTLKPVFFPPPPEVPRLQFLKSFSGPEDLGAVTTSAFEKFVLGKPETMDSITTPYGMAIFEGKLYVCDVGKRMVEVLDLENRTFSYLTKDRRLTNPVNIYIDDDGTKYIADPTAGSIFVFDKNDNLSAIFGRESKINPIDIVVRGQRCYVTDFGSNQVVVLDKTTGKEITRIGEKSKGERQAEPLGELPAGEFSLISDLALDQQGNIYVTDKAGARITQFDRSGIFKRTIGRLGDNIDEFVRPKGIAVDKGSRIWVVDAATEVAKIYNQQAQLLLFFGLPGNEPGMMNLPAKIILDYDNVELFQQYAVEGADIEFLVLVSNQYGLNKISVYGFGRFPVQEKAIEQARIFAQKPESENELERQMSKPLALTKAESKKTAFDTFGQKEEIAELYYSSMAFYRAGRLEKAREGLITVLNSGLIPRAMAKTIQDDLADIDNRLAKSRQEKEIAELYYSSMTFYRAGQFEKAREGLVKVSNSGLIPPAMAKTIQDDLADIDNRLNKSGQKSGIAELYYSSIALYRAGQLEKAREGLVKVLNSGSIPPVMVKTIKNYLVDIDNTLAKRRNTRP
ncbi:MAG: 6-bladed beta-propeller [Phycisphaerae bacterium]